jgi:Tat protein secretion system quality control protein TatD with DNase activity
MRGKPNQPAHVAMTATALAVERRVAYDEFDAAVEASAAEVFGW